jgi:hypothetical protein
LPAAVAAMIILIAAGEIAGLITARDVAIERVTFIDGKIYGVPSPFLSAATKVGCPVELPSVIRGASDDGQVATRVPACDYLRDPTCCPPGAAE